MRDFNKTVQVGILGWYWGTPSGGVTEGGIEGGTAGDTGSVLLAVILGVVLRMVLGYNIVSVPN